MPAASAAGAAGWGAAVAGGSTSGDLEQPAKVMTVARTAAVPKETGVFTKYFMSKDLGWMNVPLIIEWPLRVRAAGLVQSPDS